jgi:hypothetical protein
MAPKQISIDAIRQLPEGASWSAIVAALQEAKATEDALRRFDERGGIPDDDVTDDEWMAMICRQLADDLNDPRQDIYSLEEEGEARHESR